MLVDREKNQSLVDSGILPGFDPDTKEIRDSVWKVRDIPNDLLDRRLEITGPVDRKMIINALNSGVKVFMADFEDSLSPTWKNIINGHVYLKETVNRNIEYYDEKKSKRYILNKETATLIVRPRGLHLIEKNVSIDDKPISASLFDFGLYFVTNYESLLKNNSGPYYYIPKLESHLEARLWSNIFKFTEKEYNLPEGTIKCTVLIEHICAAFEMDEILYELKKHICGLNCGRWDYIFSFIKTLSNYRKFILPDRKSITMEQHFMSSYTKLLVMTCHKRKAYAIGGMAAQIPIKNNDELNQKNMEKVYVDKENESKMGMDGTWIAHPGLLNICRKAFNKYNNSENKLDMIITQQDLLKIPSGLITKNGVETNVITFLKYIDAWINGIGCLSINNLMEDLATAEISRMQLWQWLKYRVNIEGILLTKKYIDILLNKYLKLCENKDKCRKIFEDSIYVTNSPNFIPNIEYKYLK